MCAKPPPARQGQRRSRQRPPHLGPERPPGLSRRDQRFGPGQAFRSPGVSSCPALDANKLGYDVGVRINIDVLNAQSQLYDTLQKLSKARYDTPDGPAQTEKPPPARWWTTISGHQRPARLSRPLPIDGRIRGRSLLPTPSDLADSPMRYTDLRGLHRPAGTPRRISSGSGPKSIRT